MIRTENLWKKFGRFEALRGLSFDVPVGSAFALIGANGAGKTTTIKVLMNILTPSRGHAGDTAAHDAIRERLLGQSSTLYRSPVFGCPIGELPGS